jgi:hypothetical protein
MWARVSVCMEAERLTDNVNRLNLPCLSKPELPEYTVADLLALGDD